jgi:hypothetical protein
VGVYQSGTAVTITETFRVLNVPTDPTTVTYVVQAPDGTETTYVFGVDAEVTNPSPGVYVLDLPILTDPGVYYYSVAGTGAVEATGGGDFTILQSTIAPQDVPWPEFGPCTPWIDCADIKDFCADATDEQLQGVAMAASQIMFQISGRQFSGRCERTVRPCGDRTCWDAVAWWNWSGYPWAWTWGGGLGLDWGWGWYDGQGCHCGCAPLSRVLLPGYPVTQIIEVKIDGVVQAADTYRIDEYRFLTRMRDPAEPDVPLMWPSCQVMDLDDTAPGTFSVTYLSGVEPPLAGKEAASALACELWSAKTGADCKLPSGAVRIVRQGVTIERLQPLASMLWDGSTGIPAIDTFIAAYNPGRLKRRPAFWSPDGPKYARPVG